jgi:hypothetical protein
MGPDRRWPLGGIGKVGVSRTETGVPDEIIGIVIGVRAIVGRANAIVGGDQPVEEVIAIGPAIGGNGRGDGGDEALGVARVGEGVKRGAMLLQSAND